MLNRVEDAKPAVLSALIPEEALLFGFESKKLVKNFMGKVVFNLRPRKICGCAQRGADEGQSVLC
jgi:hypothetical protein